MPFEISAIFTWISGLDSLTLAILVIIALIIAFKIFQYLLKALVMGLMFALIPLGLRWLGFPVPVDISTVLFFILLGILTCFVYSFLSFLSRLVRR
ncbi:MAG: hypothetical protein QXP39_02500 [Candidatus Aenigmatarchaeota archaeon]